MPTVAERTTLLNARMNTNSSGPVGKADIIAALEAFQTIPGPYTVATLASAIPPEDHAGKIVYCSDGNAGAACLVYSNGTDWKVIALGSTAAAA